jgi:Secretion system C-terminal sorting domain
MVISPNPSNGDFDLMFNIQEDNQLTDIGLFDTNGKQIVNIAHQEFGKGQHALKLDLGNLPNGIYVCKLFNNNQNKIIKWLKVR